MPLLLKLQYMDDGWMMDEYMDEWKTTLIGRTTLIARITLITNIQTK
jgi:hypothetical protein